MPTSLINNVRETFKVTPSVYLILCKNNKVLLSKRVNTGYEDGNYGLVAGHVEASESLTEAMAREALEEIGLVLPQTKIELCLTMHRYASTSNPPERMDFFMRASIDEDPRNMEPNKCSELNWFALDALPENVIPYIAHALKQIATGNHYCEFGWSDR